MLLLSAVVVSPLLLALPPTDASNDWPGWRGPDQTATAPGNPPTEWSEEKNIRWKVAVPGKGLSSPVVLNGVIYLTTAVPTVANEADDEESTQSERRGGNLSAQEPGGRQRGGQQRGGQQRGRGGAGGRMSRVAPVEHTFMVIAIDYATGETKWQREAATLTPHEGTHGDGSFATPTIATDGEHLYASFGSFGIFAYDLEGTLVWETDLGDMSVQGSFGEGSSPVLAGGRLVILWAHNGDSYLVGLDRANGKEAWRVPRTTGTSWTTPTVAMVGGKEVVVVGGTSTQVYDGATGALVWYHGDDGTPAAKADDEAPSGRGRGRTTGGPIATSVSAGGHLITVTGGRRGSLLALALELPEDAAEDSDRTVWTHEGDAPRVPSPIVVDGIFYTLKDNAGVLAALDPMTGEAYYTGQRLEGAASAYASPVAAGGHLYFVGRDGSMDVVKAGKSFESVAVNSLDDKFDASPAIVGDTLVLRGLSHLYCIGE